MNRIPELLTNIALFLLVPITLLHIAFVLRTLWAIALGQPVMEMLMWAVGAAALGAILGLVAAVGLKPVQAV